MISLIKAISKIAFPFWIDWLKNILRSISLFEEKEKSIIISIYLKMLLNENLAIEEEVEYRIDSMDGGNWKKKKVNA